MTPRTITILFGIGNGYPWNRQIRSPGGGDNLFLCSMVAVDADTGEYRWHYQFNAGDSWDYDATMDIELADLKIGGKLRKVAMEAPKNGYFYVFDRTDGKLLSVGSDRRKVTWAKGSNRGPGARSKCSGIRYPTAGLSRCGRRRAARIAGCRWLSVRRPASSTFQDSQQGLTAILAEST